MAAPPSGTAWALYFDQNGDFLGAEQRDPKTGTLQPASVMFNVATNPPPKEYQFLGAKDIGEWYFYNEYNEEGKLVKSISYYHKYNCDLICY